MNGPSDRARASRQGEPPRLLVMDMTPIGGTTATGALKAAYFAGWPPDRLLHVSAPSAEHLAISDGAGRARPVTMEEAAAAAARFAPQVAVYRPVDERPKIDELARALLLDRSLPFVLWLMDDWPERLRAIAPDRFASVDEGLRTFLGRSSANLAISSRMAEVFAERYGERFGVAHNGVRAADWPERPPRRRDPFRLRYAGSLAPDMTRQTVLDVAKAVRDLRQAGLPITFEIKTHAHWLERERTAFAKLSGVTLKASSLSPARYRRWLQGADCLLLAYNFDEATRRYVHASFANKLPELLASGRPVLAVGPAEIATIAFLSREGVAETVTTRSDQALSDGLSRLARDPSRSDALGAAGRSLAFERFDLDRAVEEVWTVLYDVSETAHAGASAGAAIDQVLGAEGPAKRARRACGDHLVRRSPRLYAALRTPLAIGRKLARE